MFVALGQASDGDGDKRAKKEVEEANVLQLQLAYAWVH